MMDSREGATEMVEELNRLKDSEFRELFSRLMGEMNFNIKSSRRSGDYLLVEAEKRTPGEEALDYVVGVKRGSVEPEEIQDLVHQKKDFSGMFVSTEDISGDAMNYGNAMNVELVGGGDFIKLLHEFSLLGDIQRKRDAGMLETEGARFLPSVGELENLMGAGVSALKKGNLETALRYSNQAILLKPNYDPAWSLKARTLEKMDEWDLALDAYKQALMCNISDLELWLGLALSLYKLERHDEELEAYNQAISINEDYTRAWLNKGATLYELERYEEAIECYDEVLKKDPKNAEILSNKALALKATGDPETALTFYERATEADPEFIDARMNKIVLLEEMGKQRDVTKELDKILEARPANPKTWFYKGSIHYDLKQKKQAVAAFEKVIELDAKFEDAKKMLSKSKKLRVKKKISKEEYPCFGDHEEGEEGCEECGVQNECKENTKK
jgi:tetratricopeptide (TPR) repeat protein